MFEIIVDSAANIPAELCKKYKIELSEAELQDLKNIKSRCYHL